MVEIKIKTFLGVVIKIIKSATTKYHSKISSKQPAITVRKDRCAHSLARIPTAAPEVTQEQSLCAFRHQTVMTLEAGVCVWRSSQSICINCKIV